MYSHHYDIYYNYTISLRNKDSKLNAFSMYTGILENANPLPGRFKNLYSVMQMFIVLVYRSRGKHRSYFVVAHIQDIYCKLLSKIISKYADINELVKDHTDENLILNSHCSGNLSKQLSNLAL